MKALSVAKFGGTSVANYSAMSLCAALIRRDQKRRLVVVSACAGVTNLLISLANGVEPTQQQALLSKLKTIHYTILDQLPEHQETCATLDSYFLELETFAKQAYAAPTEKLSDRIICYGELLSSQLFTLLLKSQGQPAHCVDARLLIKTDSQFSRAIPNVAEIAKAAGAILPRLLQDGVVVTQGFIGSDAQSDTTTLGRGGSDYSAALLAEAMRADVLEIWTDVPGIYSTDPRITSAAKSITELSFNEASEMACLGAKILHPATLLPAMRVNICVFVGSAHAPELGGTWIRRHTEDAPLFRAIALRNHQSWLTLQFEPCAQHYQLLAQVMAILAQKKISVECVSTLEDCMHLLLDHSLSHTEAQSSVLPESTRRQLAQLATVHEQHDLSLISLVGNSVRRTSHAISDLFELLNDYPLRLVNFGASDHNLCFLAHASEAKDIIRTLHRRLFE
ncbi:MAG: lysine-sensitive aspartokinase 3 [Vibrionaceae bacterium]